MDSRTDIVDLDRLQRSCKLCALSQLCLPANIGGADLEQLDSIIGDKRPLERGKALFRQGDAFHSLYIVRSGSLKTFVEDPAGDVQVLGFHLPGEIVGMGGFGRDHYLGTAEALERSNVCELPYAQLEKILNQMPALHRQLVRIVNRGAELDQDHLVMMGRLHAQERLAMFLRSFASRYGRLSRDPLNLLLSMSRIDLANYLGLAMETVSRLFGRMETEGILAVDRKKVRILRLDLLTDLCGDGQFMLLGNAAD